MHEQMQPWLFVVHLLASFAIFVVPDSTVQSYQPGKVEYSDAGAAGQMHLVEAETASMGGHEGVDGAPVVVDVV